MTRKLTQSPRDALLLLLAQVSLHAVRREAEAAEIEAQSVETNSLPEAMK